jgi:ABC-2 type transport system ATP-binding protein
VVNTLETQNLTRRFAARRGLSGLRRGNSDSGVTVVEDVSLILQEGEIFGLLGLNGAGKTTLVRILCGLLLPSSGRATVLGLDVQRQAQLVRARVGLCSEDDRSFYWQLTARQNLEFFGEIHGLSSGERRGRVVDLLDLFDLIKAADQPVSQFSTGMRQRLSLARALLHRPRILFLDEPTRGLDMQASERLWTTIREQLTAKDGVTVFLTTHQLHEAEQTCHRVGILHRGHLEVVGEPGVLQQQFGLPSRYQIHVRGLTPEKLESLCQEWPAVSSENVDGKSILAFTTDKNLTIAEMLGRLHAFQAQITDIEHTPPSLAEVVRQVVS